MTNENGGELDRALDALAGDPNPPATVGDAVRRLETLGIAVGADLRRELADWLRIERSLRAHAPRPPHDFADRVADAALASNSARQAPWSWTFRLVGALAACLMIGFAWNAWAPPRTNAAAKSARPGVSVPSQNDEFPGDRLIAQVREIAPRLSPAKAPSLDWAKGANLDVKPLRDALASPAESVVEVGRRLPESIKPIGSQVREAFAFLSELKPGDASNL
jgi:hypothetical protein